MRASSSLIAMELCAHARMCVRVMRVGRRGDKSYRFLYALVPCACDNLRVCCLRESERARERERDFASP